MKNYIIMLWVRCVGNRELIAMEEENVVLVTYTWKDWSVVTDVLDKVGMKA